MRARAALADRRQLAARGRARTVIVTSGTCRGSAFFVTPTLLLTNAHVAVRRDRRGAGSAIAAVPATIVQIDDELDVALLRTEGGGGTPLPLADALGVRDGDGSRLRAFPPMPARR